MSIVFCTDYGAFTTDTWQCKIKLRIYFTVLRKFSIHYLMACRRCLLKTGNIIYANYCNINVVKAINQRNVSCIMRSRRERQKKRARERWGGKEKEGGERMEENTSIYCPWIWKPTQPDMWFLALYFPWWLWKTYYCKSKLDILKSEVTVNETNKMIIFFSCWWHISILQYQI